MFQKKIRSTLNISFIDIQRPATLEILTNADLVSQYHQCQRLLLEPVECETEDEVMGLKQKWKKIHRLLSDYGMALYLEISYDEMLIELEMTGEEYIRAVSITLVRPKIFLR